MLKLFNLIIFLLINNYAYGMSSRRVFHGKRAKVDQFPFFAQLRKSAAPHEGSYDTAWCSASLVHPRWILTAAHCFPNSKDKLEEMLDNEFIKVLMGTIIKDDAKAEERVVTYVQIHKHYVVVYDKNDPSNSSVDRVENDIAMAKLEAAYILSASINVIKLPKNEKSRCKTGLVMGIGRTDLTPGNILKYVEVPVTPLNELGEYVPPSNTTFYSKMEWSSGRTLQGDSGGPFVCTLNNVFVQYGITSNGFPSSDSEGYIVQFTDVTKYSYFIKMNIKKTNREPTGRRKLKGRRQPKKKHDVEIDKKSRAGRMNSVITFVNVLLCYYVTGIKFEFYYYYI